MLSGETMTKLIRISYFRKKTKLTQPTFFNRHNINICTLECTTV